MIHAEEIQILILDKIDPILKFWLQNEKVRLFFVRQPAQKPIS